MSGDFNIDSWRASRDERRELARRLVVDAVCSDRPKSTIAARLAELKRVSRYSLMDQRDQLLFRKFSSDLSQLVEFWPWVPDEVRVSFESGRLAFSGALKTARSGFDGET